MQFLNKKQEGFTLFEVLISMFIAGVAVLGLVMLELNILRSSQSSFNYTLATIEANTLIDKTWQNLCEIEQAGGRTSPAGKAIYTAFYNDWRASLASVNSNYTVFDGSKTAPLDELLLQDSILVFWNDKNFDSVLENDRVQLDVNFPDFSGLCL
ncbi:pilus assembly protein PilD [Psychromonas sp. psych-6C06]|uniref:prepilin-type N-terminal cleavage/methylation domain-containing protein n=1 Tax=Psychromonas sp. psych-6C06 TaxID=2058089 RepID=UPI000C31D26B|nr:prepilin-type N-terminal cleavage/methylation domain-containing protein [Psychromonas sp. psych-6C06]PKF61201.1 pilus assembly protein PilD [Psychromonas sp. psych-6C06]